MVTTDSRATLERLKLEIKEKALELQDIVDKKLESRKLHNKYTKEVKVLKKQEEDIIKGVNAIKEYNEDLLEKLLERFKYVTRDLKDVMHKLNCTKSELQEKQILKAQITEKKADLKKLDEKCAKQENKMLKREEEINKRYKVYHQEQEELDNLRLQLEGEKQQIDNDKKELNEQLCNVKSFDKRLQKKEKRLERYKVELLSK